MNNETRALAHDVAATVLRTPGLPPCFVQAWPDGGITLVPHGSTIEHLYAFWEQRTTVGALTSEPADEFGLYARTFTFLFTDGATSLPVRVISLKEVAA